MRPAVCQIAAHYSHPRLGLTVFSMSAMFCWSSILNWSSSPSQVQRLVLTASNMILACAKELTPPPRFPHP